MRSIFLLYLFGCTIDLPACVRVLQPAERRTLLLQSEWPPPYAFG